MKPLATDTHDFPSLRRDGKIYVDKTEFIYRLIAHSQIRKKGYAEPYLADGRPIWLIGLSFDSKTRRLVDYAAERFDGSNFKPTRPQGQT